jgi:Protein of unknown function (DUF2800)
MTRHSSIVGGSTADRVLNCPGSYQATLALPSAVEISSDYAEEGTAMHGVMEGLMRNKSPGVDLRAIARKLIGVKFNDRRLTQEHLDTMIYPALDALDELEAAYGGGDRGPTSIPFDVLAIEHGVRFPGIPGAFGTIDLILGNADTVLHVDWKFGAGVGVFANYWMHDANGDAYEKTNPQLMFYAAAAMSSARHFYRNKKILGLAIIQPRGVEPLSHTAVSRKEIKWFVEDMQAAVVKALEKDPIRQKGEWCRFAPCKLTCPLWTGPMLELPALQLVPRTEVVAKEITPYAEYLARAKALVDILAMYKKEVDEQLHAYLEDGGTVPGWRLKAKVKDRKWIDDETVEQTLINLGFDDDEIWQRKLQTFKVADAAAKRLGVKIPDELRVAPPSNETTVCTADDPAPPVERGLVVEQFAAALAALAAPPKG